MRRFIVGLCALAAIVSIGAAAAAADGPVKFAAEARKGHVETARPAQIVACLGGVLE